MAYTLKELKEMKTEELIVMLMMSSSSETKATRNKEEKIVKVLHEREIVDYDIMKSVMEQKCLW